MPVFAYTHGIVITIFVLLHTSIAQYTKLSPIKSGNSLSNLSATKTTKRMATATTLYSVQQTASASSRINSSTRRSRQTPDTSYQMLANDDITYSVAATSFNYPDYRNTGEISTITYPYITTPRPTMHTLRYHTQPYSTKLSVKPIRRIPTRFPSESAIDDGVENDFVPLMPLYKNAVADSRWSVVPAQPAPPQYPYPVRTASSHTHIPTATGWSATGLSLTGATSSGWAGVHELPTHHVAQRIIPITIHEIQHKPRIDYKKWGIIALVKIGIAKLKAFGILKMLFFLLLKYKLILVVLFTKFVLFLKAIKVLKALLIPLLLLALLPLLLLLLPLLLIPLLLPLLLLLLPVPVPALVRDKNGKARISVFSHMKVNDTDVIMDMLSQLLDSEQCVERIACQLATKKESKIFHPIVNWYLQKLGNVIKNEKIRSYVKAYSKSVKEYDHDDNEQDGEIWCARKYACANVSSGGSFVDGANTKKSK